MFICVHLWLLPAVLAQEGEQEVVANMAAGRVILSVGRDGIVIAAAEDRLEPGSHPPLVIPLGPRRIGVMLGATEWVWPGGGHTPVRLDHELLRIAGEAASGNTSRVAEAERASDIESIGVGLLEKVRELTEQLHRHLNLKPEEAVLELLVANYEQNYGAEVWLVRYRVAQDPMRGDFWRTRALRPSYTQLYPPEKHQPRTLIEVHYPPEDTTPELLELLRKDDPRLARVRSSEPAMVKATEALLKGESHKSAAKDQAELLHATLPILTPPEAKLALGVLYEEKGFDWILAPAEPLEKADQGNPREPGAPSLLRKKPPQ